MTTRSDTVGTSVLYRNLSGVKDAEPHAAKLLPASLQKRCDSLTNGVHLCLQVKG